MKCSDVSCIGTYRCIQSSDGRHIACHTHDVVGNRREQEVVSILTCNFLDIQGLIEVIVCISQARACRDKVRRPVGCICSIGSETSTRLGGVQFRLQGGFSIVARQLIGVNISLHSSNGSVSIRFVLVNVTLDNRNGCVSIQFVLVHVVLDGSHSSRRGGVQLQCIQTEVKGSFSLIAGKLIGVYIGLNNANGGVSIGFILVHIVLDSSHSGSRGGVQLQCVQTNVKGGFSLIAGQLIGVHVVLKGLQSSVEVFVSVHQAGRSREVGRCTIGGISTVGSKTSTRLAGIQLTLQVGNVRVVRSNVGGIRSDVTCIRADV